MKIKNRIEKELANYIQGLNKAYCLGKISPLLCKNIKDFLIRSGKRLRPTLFILGYLGFAPKIAPHLYKTALSFELLHDFLLIHDDIVDKAATRRGKPSMHKMFDNYLSRAKSIKFNGQDLAIITGDVIYALALEAFLSIKEDWWRKEQALRMFIRAALFTGLGEFIELLIGLKDLQKVKKQDIYRIYDWKTACYSFAAPLSCGAILGGARKLQIDRLYRYGIYLGRAFQIKDDILGIFAEEKKTGKSTLADLQEAKKTLLIWYAYQNCDKKRKLYIKKILTKNKVNHADLLKMRQIISACGALDFARKEIHTLLGKASFQIKSLRMHPEYKALLHGFCQQLLTL